MAYQVAPFTITIPAGTPKAAPVTVKTPLGNLVVVGIEITVPPGFNGAVGFRFTSGGGPVIPSDPAAWIIASGQDLNWPISGQLSSGAWEVTGYNLGVNDHSLYVRYLLDLPAALNGSSPTALLDPALISGAGVPMIAGSIPGAGQ